MHSPSLCAIREIRASRLLVVAFSAAVALFTLGDGLTARALDPRGRIVPGDFDADGRSDITLFRPSDRTWRTVLSSGGLTVTVWGEPTDVPVQGDFDGDGRSDRAMFRPTDGT
jgi:hypothetical protein